MSLFSPLVFDGLNDDILDLVLDTTEFQDIVLAQLVVEFLLALLQTAHHKVHALGYLCWKLCRVVGKCLRLIFSLILGK
jgi:hypothetical protein